MLFENIVLIKRSSQRNSYSYFSEDSYAIGTPWNRLVELHSASTHNKCFRGEIRKYQYRLVERSLLSVTMEEERLHVVVMMKWLKILIKHLLQ